MWFDDGERTGRRWARRNKRRFGLSHPILAVNTRLNQQRARNTRQFMAVLMTLLVAGGAVALGYFGVTRVYGFLFTENGGFAVRTLDIRTEAGAVVTPALVREWSRVMEGTNIFAVSIGQIRTDFLTRVANVKNIEVTRILPDTLRIEITERSPLAVIQQKKGPDVFVDDQGCIFSSRARRETLAVITGYGGPRLSPDSPGRQVGGLLRDAVLVLDTSKKLAGAAETNILWVDARGRFSGREDALQLRMEGDALVDLWWPRRQQDNMRGVKELQKRLVFLGGILRRAKQDGKIVRTVNLTLDNYAENCPVVMD